VSRFARPATEAGVVEPRSGPAPGSSSRQTTFARLVGAAGMIAITAVLYWLLTDTAFRVTAADVVVEGLRYSDESAVREHLAGLDRAPNALRVRTSEIVRDLGDLPAVAAADATVTLPARVSLRLEEREPIFTWSDGRTDWLVDRAGWLFAPVPIEDEGGTPPGGPGAMDAGSSGAPTDGSEDGAAAPVVGSDARSPIAATVPPAAGSDSAGDGAPAASGSTAQGRDARPRTALPRIDDWRERSASIVAAARLPAIDLLVMRQLLALTPESLGSRASQLTLRANDDTGYVLSSDGWQAIFGHYTPTLRPPEDLPRQVQCLRWLLAAGEKRLDTVRLAVSTNGCGTYRELEKRSRAPSP
jgi:hypothetical protein